MRKGNSKGRGGKGEARKNKHSEKLHFEERPKRRLDESELYEIIDEHPKGLYLILDCIQDPHNLGAIMRTADAAGVKAIVAPKDKSVGITETVRQVSVGAADTMPFFAVTNLSRTIKTMQEKGIWLVGTTDRGQQSLYEVDLKGGIGIVTGSEEKGMRRLTEEACDHLISIPMEGTVPCLNASVATAVCLYEAVRQRSQ